LIDHYVGVCLELFLRSDAKTQWRGVVYQLRREREEGRARVPGVVVVAIYVPWNAGRSAAKT
jgi:hypothetical protein